eukprot:2067781-Pyramimonas_sp.AAC.1
MRGTEHVDVFCFVRFEPGEWRNPQARCDGAGKHSQHVFRLGALSITLYFGSSRMIPMADDGLTNVCFVQLFQEKLLSTI